MTRKKEPNNVNETSWQDASIAMVAIISGAVLLSVLIKQISRIIQAGMETSHKSDIQALTGTPDQAT